MEKSYNIKYEKPMTKTEFYEYLRLEDEKEKGDLKNTYRLKFNTK